MDGKREGARIQGALQALTGAMVLKHREQSQIGTGRAPHNRIGGQLPCGLPYAPLRAVTQQRRVMDGRDGALGPGSCRLPWRVNVAESAP